MISFITILLFFIYCGGLGYTALYLLKKPESLWEKVFLILAVGLGIFPILAVFLNFIHIPLDWKIFLLLSLAFPLFVVIKKIQKKQLTMPRFSFSFKKSDLILLGAVLIMLLSLFMYTKGAFAYPYLEDEDPWGHAVGAKYVALEKSSYDPPIEGQTKIDQVLSYIDPYPPAYDVLMGVLHQTSPDLPWTLKFFNALIISLGLLFFYLFSKKFLDSAAKALLATFFLAMAPAYFSHFIWAHSYVVALFFPAMYALLMIAEDKRWFWIASLLVASIWVTQNIEEPIKLTVMMLLFVLAASVIHKRFFKLETGAIGLGILISFMWWGMMIYKYSLRGFIRYFTGNNIVAATNSTLDVSVGSSVNSAAHGTIFQKIAGILHSLTSSGGTASRAYSLHDFVIAKNENLINSPIGIGLVLSLLVLFGVLYSLWHYRSRLVEPENTALAVILLWLLYTFWGVNGQTFPVPIARGPFSMWLLLAIPVALVAAEGTYLLIKLLKRWNVPKLIIITIIVLGVIITSGYAKYQVNTSIWPTSGAFSTPAEPVEYAQWFETIPLNSKVFVYTPRDKIVIGLGGESCLWCPEVIAFREDILHQDAQQLHRFLKNQGYEYLILNPVMDRKMFTSAFGNETDQILPQRYDEIQKSGLFTPAYYKQNQFLVLK